MKRLLAIASVALFASSVACSSSTDGVSTPNGGAGGSGGKPGTGGGSGTGGSSGSAQTSGGAGTGGNGDAGSGGGSGGSGGIAASGSGGTAGAPDTGGSAGGSGSAQPDAAGGSGGSSGGGGKSDAGNVSDAQPSEAASGDSGLSAKRFKCNAFWGPTVVSDWFTDPNGFEKQPGIDGARWEAKTSHLSTIDKYSDPTSDVWPSAIASKCTQNGDTPDRIILTVFHWDDGSEPTWTQAQWESNTEKAVSYLRTKFPSLQELDLATMVRAPGNKQCQPVTSGDEEQVVKPVIDVAVQAVAGRSNGFVKVAPKYWAPSCAVFSQPGPHYATGGAAKVAAVIASLYVAEP